MTETQRCKLFEGALVLHPDGDPDHPVQEDILVCGDTIVAVGSDVPAKRQGLAPEVVDVSGKLITPGLINAHYHSHDVLLRGCFENLPMEIWILYASPTSYARRSNDEVGLRTLVGATECLLSGITTVQDMVSVVGADRDHCSAILDAYERSGLRVALGLQASDLVQAESTYLLHDPLPAGFEHHPPEIQDIEQTKALIEALLQGVRRPRLDWVLAPSAPQRCSEGFLRWVAALSQKHDCRVFTHVCETKGQAVLARKRYGADGGSYLRYLERVGLLNDHLTIAHGVWITPEEIRMLADHQTSAVLNAMSNLRLRSGVAPVRDYVAHGVNVAIGCDNCSGSGGQNLFESMKLFATFLGLQEPAGSGGSARHAFRAATLGGAKALGQAGKLGVLRAGAKADLVVFDLSDPAFIPRNNLLHQLVYSATPRAVDMSVVGGEIVVRNGRLTHLDLPALAGRAEQAALALRHDLAEVMTRNQAYAQRCLAADTRGEDTPLELDRYRL